MRRHSGFVSAGAARSETLRSSDSISRPWRESIAAYARPDGRRALIQLLITALPFLGLMILGILVAEGSPWAALLLSVPLAALLVRLFMIQHDCGHGSFFKRRWANDQTGRLIGVLTLTPYGFWRRRHALHHASSGHLDRRGVGDVTTMTRREYLASSRWRRSLYRFYRHPLIMFGLGPIYLFGIRHRIPTGSNWRCWASVLGTNAAIAGLIAGLVQVGGLAPFLWVYVPTVLLAATAGVWLFYIQHQFEQTYWENGEIWDFHAAALQGCSFYDLPRPLHWVTCHIGLHHIHHLSSKIPNYRLRECFEQTPSLQSVRRIGLRESLRCARLAVWDEERKRLVSFKELAVRA